ncbi:hypothetical protein ACS7SF_09825 [Ralstonia sp. 25C]|uniref:hypothetical protein n=1 Tax=Ralstonia sp. 25C TaxID=3447363 RepID=UPI003F755075
MRDLLLELDDINRTIHRVRLAEISAETMAARFPHASSATRKQLQRLLAAPPQRRGISASEHRAQLAAWVCKLAQAWGGVCLTPDYQGRHVPYQFKCEARHSFSMSMHSLRLGAWCRTCAYDRAGYTLEHARAAAMERGGRCLSERYDNGREPLRWSCEAGHSWSASFERVLRGNWCPACHDERIKPRQEDIERVAAKRGGRCLSVYIDKATPLQWHCAEGHTWEAPWFRIKKGQWCHRCAVKARTRTIEQMQELACSRGGRCLSTTYSGAHGKLEWACSRGHVWWATANSVWRGHWCPVCARENPRTVRTQTGD